MMRQIGWIHVKDQVEEIMMQYTLWGIKNCTILFLQ